MTEASHDPRIDPELEARIVALVLGEASDLEQDQLLRIIEQRPELATLKQEFESMHGLLREVGEGESPANDDDWKLPADQRTTVLAVIRGEAVPQSAKQLAARPDIERTSTRKYSLRSILKIAAVFPFASLFGLFAIAILLTAGVTSSIRTQQFETAAMKKRSSSPMVADQGYSRDGSGPPETKGSMDSPRSGTMLAIPADTKAPANFFASGVDDANESQSALADIRKSLGTDTTPVTPSRQWFADEFDSGGIKLERSSEVAAGGESNDKYNRSGETPPIKNFTLPTEPMPDLYAEFAPAESRFGSSELAKEQALDGKQTETAGVRDVQLWDTDGEKQAGREGPQQRSRNANDPPTDRWESRENATGSSEGLSYGVNSPEFEQAQLQASEATSPLRGGETFRFATPPTDPGSSQSDFDDDGQGWGESQFENGDQATDLQRAQVVRSQLGTGFVPQSDSLPAYDTRGGLIAPLTLDSKSQSMKGLFSKRQAAPAGLSENHAADEAFSTFSLHVSDVSFKLAQSALAQGEWPETAKIRVEEFVNAFDYNDPMPSQSERVACRMEQSIHPFLQQRNLLRVSMRTAAEGRSSNTPLRLTLLLDNSGSMERVDRQQTVRRAFALLAQQLKPIDQVTLISFARQPRLLADKVSGAQSDQLVQLIENLPSEGGTNIEAALLLAFEKAREQQTGEAQNRIVLLTDGAVNLGNANPDSLSRTITGIRDAGIAFDAAGISAEGLNDEILEALTRQGDGRYYLLDSVESADDGFARQIAGALRPSAKNVKVQVEFNPKRVGYYKLLGFEKHLLDQEDFRNDKVDAAEMAAAEAGVAVYQFEPKPDGEGDVGSVSVRFRDLSTGQMVENRWPIPYEADAPRPDLAAPSIRIATAAAMLAAKLQGDALGQVVDLGALSELISGLPDHTRNAARVQQLQQMIQQAREVSGE